MFDELKKKILIKLVGLGVDDKVAYKYLLDLDRLSIITIDGVLTKVEKGKEQQRKAEDIITSETDLAWKKSGDGFGDWEKEPCKQLQRQICPKYSTAVLGEDDYFGKYTCLEAFLANGLRSSVLFPMEDLTLQIASNEDATTLMEQTGLSQGKSAPMTYNTQPFDMQTDESFSRIFFYGIGVSLLEARNESKSISSTSGYLGPFIVDMPLQDLKVRKGFRSYGARIHFSEHQQVTAIFDYGKEKLLFPGDVGWDEAKFLAKITAFTLVTAREHLIWTHLILSNTATRDSILHLPPSHPLRRLLTVFTYGSTEINLDAFDSLVPESSLLHRALGLEYESVEAVFEMAYEQCNIYEPFGDRQVHPTIQKMSNEGKFPYIKEGKAYFEIVRSFVREWIVKAGDAAKDEQALAFYDAVKKSSAGQKYEIPDYTETNMINLIAQMIFTVTAFHELVGAVVDYVNLTHDKAGFRACEGKSTVDLQSFVIAACIGASTSVRMPSLMSDFKNFFGVGGAPSWERDLWNDFLDKLRVQSDAVKSADALRSVEFKYFDPARFECSVSV